MYSFCSSGTYSAYLGGTFEIEIPIAFMRSSLLVLVVVEISGSLVKIWTLPSDVSAIKLALSGVSSWKT